MIHDIYTKNPKSIRAVLDSWIATQKYYIKESEDLPWWYNERASISMLAAAAWKLGNVALEEYSTIKGIQSEDKKSGRCDWGPLILNHTGHLKTLNMQSAQK